MMGLLEILEAAKQYTGQMEHLSEIPSERIITPAIFSVPLPSPESSKYKPGSLGFVSSPRSTVLPPI